MIKNSKILSNRLAQSLALCIIISISSCQQEKQQPVNNASQAMLANESSSSKREEMKKKSSMTFYLTRFSYTPETWARMMKNPEDRRLAANKYIESVGGKLNGFWYALGEYDGYCLWEAPDNVSMASVGFAISGGGALSKFETTVLLTVDETLTALQQAQSISYTSPGNK